MARSGVHGNGNSTQMEPELKLIVNACIGGVSGLPPPLRIFPVRGSSSLRLHCEHGVPLCRALSPCLAEQSQVLRLAERCVPLLDSHRLSGIEGLEETMQVLPAGHAM